MTSVFSATSRGQIQELIATGNQAEGSKYAIQGTDGWAPSLKGAGTSEFWIREETVIFMRSRMGQATQDNSAQQMMLVFSPLPPQRPSNVTKGMYQHLPADRNCAGRHAEMAC